jgi:hypothetical protein
MAIRYAWRLPPAERLKWQKRLVEVGGCSNLSHSWTEASRDSQIKQDIAGKPVLARALLAGQFEY